METNVAAAHDAVETSLSKNSTSLVKIYFKNGNDFVSKYLTLRF